MRQMVIEHDLQERTTKIFLSLCHRMNGAAAVQTAQTEQSDTLDRRQEKLALIRELRDTTQSRSTYERCVAIVGERGA
jgi:hypothetical protein